jgi:hypothetical protein
VPRALDRLALATVAYAPNAAGSALTRPWPSPIREFPEM